MWIFIINCNSFWNGYLKIFNSKKYNHGNLPVSTLTVNLPSITTKPYIVGKGYLGSGAGIFLAWAGGGLISFISSSKTGSLAKDEDF